METIHLAYCGLNCAECPVFIATITNDTELKQRTADEWGLDFGQQVTALTNAKAEKHLKK